MFIFLRAGSLLICALLLSHSLSAATLHQQRYDLRIAEQLVTVAHQRYSRITVNGQFTAPTLEFVEGDVAEIHVYNDLPKQATAIHWHGILLPGMMDGVHALNQFQAIETGQEFIYRFPIRQSGTYWYHAHAKGQEQDGLYGAIMIHPKASNQLNSAQQPMSASNSAITEIVMLSDFHASKSQQILRHLKQSGDYYQQSRQTLGDVFKQAATQGWRDTWQARTMWNKMRMSPTDLADVSGYQYLINGQTQDAPWQRDFTAQQPLRLRIVNASAMTFFDLRIPQLTLKVVAADGQEVQPMDVDELRIAPSETYDVLVLPQAQDYQIQAEALDRSGFALGYLRSNAPVKNSQAALLAQPIARPRTLLSMQDMGMHNIHMQHDAMVQKPMDAQAMPAQPSDNNAMAMHDMSAMKNMDDMPMHHHAMSTPTTLLVPKAPLAQQQRSTIDHSAHRQPLAQPATTVRPLGWADASTPKNQRVLRYTDLVSLNLQPDTRPASRSIDIHLDGNMQRYIWTLNGKTQAQAEPIQLRYGERVRIHFINDSMMAHPMHLHGMFMQLDNGQDPSRMPNKHTVIVPPGQRVSVLLTANEEGEWLLHCHLLYHMMAGMMNQVVVSRDHHMDDASMDPSAIPSPMTLAAPTHIGGTHEHH